MGGPRRRVGAGDRCVPPRIIRATQRLNLNTADFKYDESEPEGYRSGLARLGPLLGAAETGPDGEEELAQGDIVLFAIGPDGAHRVRRESGVDYWDRES
jgi:hypothetical protein